MIHNRALAAVTAQVHLRMPKWQLALYAAANLPILIVALGGMTIDWRVLADAPSAYFRGDLYESPDVPYLWSPVAALMLAAFVPIGYVGWSILHFAAIATLREPTLIMLAALSGAFWFDLIFGSAMTFVVASGVLALRGSRAAGYVYVALFVLMPRPLQLPLLAILMWQQPSWRAPALAIGVLHGFAVLLTGYGPEWIAAAATAGSQQASPDINWGPTALMGMGWLALGIPLAVWLASRGYPGLAGLAVSPYVLPHYALMLLCDVAYRVLSNGPSRVGQRAAAAPDPDRASDGQQGIAIRAARR